MNSENLKSMIRQLVAVEGTAAPVLSCYVNAEEEGNGYRRALDERVRALRCTWSPKRARGLRDGAGPG